MGKFDSLQKTKNQKRALFYNFAKIYRKGRFATSVEYPFFENKNAEILLAADKKKKCNQNLLTLWGILDIRSYIDFDLGNTINPYFLDSSELTPIKDLEEYNFMYEDARKLNLLDIKYIKSLKISSLILENLYIATYEIADKNNEYRPYVLLFTMDKNKQFIQIGYGYDTNDNGNVELFIKSFNYPIFLTPKGFIDLPLMNSSIKIKVYDYVTDTDIQKLLTVASCS